MLCRNARRGSTTSSCFAVLVEGGVKPVLKLVDPLLGPFGEASLTAEEKV
jgi:hypothetical protein